jgi:hypothetical protein
MTQPNSEVRTGPKRTKQGAFEDRLLTAGRSILEALPASIFRDEQAVNDAALYLGWLEQFNDDKGYMDDEINVALYKIIGTPAIDGRARDEGVQAHVGIFFPRHASKDDKKRLERMQFKNRDNPQDENDQKKDRD